MNDVSSMVPQRWSEYYLRRMSIDINKQPGTKGYLSVTPSGLSHISAASTFVTSSQHISGPPHSQASVYTTINKTLEKRVRRFTVLMYTRHEYIGLLLAILQIVLGILMGIVQVVSMSQGTLTHVYALVIITAMVSILTGLTSIVLTSRVIRTVLHSILLIISVVSLILISMTLFQLGKIYNGDDESFIDEHNFCGNDKSGDVDDCLYNNMLATVLLQVLSVLDVFTAFVSLSMITCSPKYRKSIFPDDVSTFSASMG